jgi:DNA-directed RNA polymerase subunit RPC12/RpoP
MTDILARLAALTAKDRNGLLQCAICGHPNEVDGVKPTIESNRRRVVCTHCGMTTIWCDSASHAIETANTRPREAALIALVQEAAGEIGRLRDFVGFIRMKAEWRFQGSDYVAEEDPSYTKVSETAQAATAYLREILAIANRALNPQEPA